LLFRTGCFYNLLKIEFDFCYAQHLFFDQFPFYIR
jgi:hypothetical protein